MGANPHPRDYWDERLRKHWGPHGVGSLAYGRQYNRWLYRVRRHAFLDVRRSLDKDPRKARVLDVGCGTGFYLDLWREQGVAQLSGLDFSASTIERLRPEYPHVELHQADIGDSVPPAASGSFDIVGAFDVLFHIVDDTRYENALRNIHAMLDRDGLFLYSDNFIRSEPRRHLDYWKSRTLREIEAALERAGFRILERKPVFVLMGSPVDSDSRLHRLLWDSTMKVVQRSEAVGFALGAGLFPWELLLRKILPEGPSTEVAVCRKL